MQARQRKEASTAAHLLQLSECRVVFEPLSNHSRTLITELIAAKTVQQNAK